MLQVALCVSDCCKGLTGWPPCMLMTWHARCSSVVQQAFLLCSSCSSQPQPKVRLAVQQQTAVERCTGLASGKIPSPALPIRWQACWRTCSTPCSSFKPARHPLRQVAVHVFLWCGHIAVQAALRLLMRSACV